MKNYILKTLFLMKNSIVTVLFLAIITPIVSIHGSLKSEIKHSACATAGYLLLTSAGVGLNRTIKRKAFSPEDQKHPYAGRAADICIAIGSLGAAIGTISTISMGSAYLLTYCIQDYIAYAYLLSLRPIAKPYFDYLKMCW